MNDMQDVNFSNWRLSQAVDIFVDYIFERCTVANGPARSRSSISSLFVFEHSDLRQLKRYRADKEANKRLNLV